MQAELKAFMDIGRILSDALTRNDLELSNEKVWPFGQTDTKQENFPRSSIALSFLLSFASGDYPTP